MAVVFVEVGGGGGGEVSVEERGVVEGRLVEETGGLGRVRIEGISTGVVRGDGDFLYWVNAAGEVWTGTEVEGWEEGWEVGTEED